MTLVARREDRLRELADELGAGAAAHAEVIAADLAEAESRDQLAAAVESNGRAVEILVNNAGVGEYVDFTESDREGLLAMARLNMEALLDLQARYLPPMVERGRGAVVNIASTAAFQPIPGNAAYAATKAFVLSFGQAVHEEVKRSGVTVTTVCPGPVRTEFSEIAGIGGAEKNTPGFVWTEPEEVAAAALHAAERGSRTRVVGTLNRVMATAGQHSPRSVVLPLVERVFKIAQ